MSYSAFTFKSQNVTTINDNGTVNLNQFITQSQAAHQIFDWVEVAGCVEPGDILYRNPNTGMWDRALATNITEAEALGVVETVNGCGPDRTVKIVYQGRLDLPATYTVINGGVYFLSDAYREAETGPLNIRNGSTTEPDNISKPMYVGTGQNRIVVVNYRGLYKTDDIPPVVPPSGEIGISKTCYSDGVEFTIRNIGSSDINETVTYTAYQSDGTTILDTGAISGIALGGAPTVLTYRTGNQMEEGGFIKTVGSNALLTKTEISTCPVDPGNTITVNIKLSALGKPDYPIGPGGGTGGEWAPSDPFTVTANSTVAFSNTPIQPVAQYQVLQIVEKNIIAPIAPVIEVAYSNGNATRFVYDSLAGAWVAGSPQGGDQVVSLTFNP